MSGFGALAETFGRVCLRDRHQLRAGALARRGARLSVARRRLVVLGGLVVFRFLLRGHREESTGPRLSCNRPRVPGFMTVIVLLADGIRPDTLASALDSGACPALSQLRAAGGMHTLTSTFPSVTGPAYVPF